MKSGTAPTSPRKTNPTETMRRSRKIDWKRLYSTAHVQFGLFTETQAAECGYSRRCLLRRIRATEFTRLRRGIYRLTYYPVHDFEGLLVWWLWSNREGTFCGETALSLHDLSSVLPSRIHLAVPPCWKRRRRRRPKLLVLHYVNVSEDEKTFCRGGVPTTKVLRTLADCREWHTSQDQLDLAWRQARDRGLVPPVSRD